MFSSAATVQQTEQSTIPLSAKVFVLSCVMGITVFQRIAVTSFEFPLVTLILYAGLVLLLFDRQVKIDIVKCSLYLVCMLALTSSTLLGRLYGWASSASDLVSLLWVFVLYLPFVLVWAGNPVLTHNYLVDVFVNTMSVMAVVAILQYALQLFGIDLSELIWSALPDSIVRQGYNYEIQIEWGHHLRKSNGVFFLEPSFLCKAMGTAILVELLYRGNVIRLLLFHIAVVLSFSGTGIILLASGYIFLVGKLNIRIIAFLLGVLLIVTLFASITGYSDIFVNRFDEFSSTRSSAHTRFIAPFASIVELELYNNLISSYGPGSVDLAAERFYSHPGYYLKFLYEYGLIPAILFTLFIITCATTYGTPFALVFALLVSYFLLAGGLFESNSITTLVLFTSLFRFWPKKYADTPV